MPAQTSIHSRPKAPRSEDLRDAPREIAQIESQDDYN